MNIIECKFRDGSQSDVKYSSIRNIIDRAGGAVGAVDFGQSLMWSVEQKRKGDPGWKLADHFLTMICCMEVYFIAS